MGSTYYVGTQQKEIIMKLKTTIQHESGLNIRDYIDPVLLQDMVQKKYINESKSPCGNFRLYDYSRSAQYEQVWNDATMKCRGLVVDNNDDLIVAMCLPKFFNYQESPTIHKEQLVKNINNPFVATEKMDGSFGNVWFDKYQETWRVSTRGSFVSDQAKWATDWLLKLPFFSQRSEFLEGHYSLVCEIIYPENRIVVDYGDTKELVLLTVYDIDFGVELSQESVHIFSHSTGLRKVPTHSFSSVSDIIETCKTLDGNHEGYVVRYDDGFRLKIKGDEYCKLHKVISGLSTTSIWENIDCDYLEMNKSFLELVPEEFLPEVVSYGEKLIAEIMAIRCNTIEEFNTVGASLPSNHTEKDFALAVASKKHPNLLFAIKKERPILQYIHKMVKPEFRKFGNFEDE